MKVLLYQLRWSWALGLVIALFASCNEEYKNLLNDDYTEPIRTKADKKVLYVIMDGVNGKVLQGLRPTHIMGMTTNALYSFDALIDIEEYPTDNLAGWSNLLTGKSPSGHGAIGNGAVPDLDANPTILSLAKQSSLVASSQLFYDTFGTEAVSASVESSDGEAYQKALALIGSSDDDLIMVEFNSADVAGAASGYASSNTAYSEAIGTIDTYIGGLKDAVAARPTYGTEDWLIVVTSNRGGENPTVAPNNYFLNPAKSIFTMYYSPKLAQREYVAPDGEIPFNTTAAQFKLHPSFNQKAQIEDPGQFVFDMPNINDGYTVEAKMKLSGNGGSSWPELISKATNADNAGNNGWVLNSGSNASACQARLGNQRYNSAGPILGNGIWHTLTVTFTRTATNTVTTKLYLDGTNYASFETTNISSRYIGDNNEKLTVGVKRTGGVTSDPTLSMSNLTIYNVPFSDTDIANHFCRTEVEESHPHYASMIGYWMFSEGTGNVIPNRVNSDPSQAFVLVNNASFGEINEYSPHLCPPLSDAYFTVLPFAVDNPFMIGNWLNMDKLAIRKMDGRTWPFLYATNED